MLEYAVVAAIVLACVVFLGKRFGGRKKRGNCHGCDRCNSKHNGC